MLYNKRAREIFLSSIDRSLDTFGTSVRTVIYFEMKRSFGVTREDIPIKPELFVKTIEKIFGVGSATVERTVLKELEASTGVKDLSRQKLETAIRTAYHHQLEKLS
jgi:hypothetical protein